MFNRIKPPIQSSFPPRRYSGSNSDAGVFILGIAMRCTGCKKEKDNTEFSPSCSKPKKARYCKQCMSEKWAKWAATKDKEYHVSRVEKWKKQNIERWNDCCKRYREKNKEKLILYYREKRATNIEYQLRDRMSRRLREVLSGKKRGKRWEELVGYSVSDLKAHLESLFLPGMTWTNRGEWEIDHVKPVILFHVDSYDHPGFKQCWALSNLQPLWRTDNRKKSCKY
jgi:hypothetical protein